MKLPASMPTVSVATATRALVTHPQPQSPQSLPVFTVLAEVDTFVTRAGDVLSAAAVALGQVAALSVATFATMNIRLTLVSLFVARQIAREHRRRTV
jgi:hypothetical protein